MRLNETVSLVASGGMSLGMTHPSDCNAYLVDCGKESVLIDAGTGLAENEMIREIEKDLKNTLSYILITHHHADHTGGLSGVKEYFQAKVMVPEKERRSIEEGDEKANGLDIARNAGYYPADYKWKGCRADRAAVPGEQYRISEEEIQVCDGSGHSPGGVCYYFPAKKMIFVGDLLMHGGRINLQNIPGADIRRYAESVIALENLEVEQFYSGHGCFSLHYGKEHIEKAVQAFKSLGMPPNFL